MPYSTHHSSKEPGELFPKTGKHVPPQGGKTGTGCRGSLSLGEGVFQAQGPALYKEIRPESLQAPEGLSQQQLCGGDGLVNEFDCNDYFTIFVCGCLATQLCLTLFGLLCPWNFPGKNTGAGCHFFLQGIFLEGDLLGSNPHLLHLLFSRWIPYLWRQLRSPLQYICGSKHQTVHFKHTQFLFIKKKNHRHPSALSSTGSTQVAESQLPSGGTLPGTTSQEAIAR